MNKINNPHFTGGGSGEVFASVELNTLLEKFCLTQQIISALCNLSLLCSNQYNIIPQMIRKNSGSFWAAQHIDLFAVS